MKVEVSGAMGVSVLECRGTLCIATSKMALGPVLTATGPGTAQASEKLSHSFHQSGLIIIGTFNTRDKCTLFTRAASSRTPHGVSP